MKIRKILNIPNKEQEQLILDGVKQFYCKVDEYCRKENEKEYELEKRSNNTCPNCQNKNIVNKIQDTIGYGSVNGESSFGFGYIRGKTTISTEPVNHCGNCGNQWKKYKTHYTYRLDITTSWLNYLSHDEDSLMKRLVIDELTNIPSESIWRVFREVGDSCYYSTQSKLKLSKLRKQFKSVYDHTI